MALTPKPLPVEISNFGELAAEVAGMNAYLDVTPGTAQASAALVTDANGNVNLPTGTGIEVNGVPVVGSTVKSLVTTGLVNTTLANIKTGTYAAAPVLAHLAGHQFVPTDIKVRADGSTATTADGVQIVEETSGHVIAQFPIALLTAGQLVTVAGAGVLAAYLGVAGTAAKGLYLSAYGSGTLAGLSGGLDVIVTGYWI